MCEYVKQYNHNCGSIVLVGVAIHEMLMTLPFIAKGLNISEATQHLVKSP